MVLLLDVYGIENGLHSRWKSISLTLVGGSISLIIAILSYAGVILSPEIIYPKNGNFVLSKLHFAAANLTPYFVILAKIIPRALICSSRVFVNISKSSQYTFTKGNPLNIIDITPNNADEEC